MRTTKRALPIGVPNRYPNGGVVHLDKTEGQRLSPNSHGDNNYMQTLYIGGLGHGAGGIIFPASGPVLIGTGSLNSYLGSTLWITVSLLLFISAMIWATIHLVCSPRRENKCMAISNRRRKGYWIGNFEEPQSRTIDQLSLLQMKLEIQKERSALSLESRSTRQNTQSLGNIYHAPSTQLSMMNAGLMSPSSNSIWSCAASSQEYLLTQNGQPKGLQARSHIINCQQLALIFTISGEKCPNVYRQKDGTIAMRCELSVFEECLEIFLLCGCQCVVGKMRKRKRVRNEEEFAIQIWRTTDGSLLPNVPYGSTSSYMTCDAACCLHDKYLILIRQGELYVWNMVSNFMVSSAVIERRHLVTGRYSIQPTSCGLYVVVMVHEAVSGAVQIYAHNFDQLLLGSPVFVHRSWTCQQYFYCSISKGCIYFGYTGEDLAVWNFFDNTDRLLNRDHEERICKVLASCDGDLLLVQSDHRLSIWRTFPWDKLSEILMSFLKVCAITLGDNGGPQRLLAVAIDDGSIQLFTASDGHLVRVLHASVPIVEMSFASDDLVLVVMADRASHYRLFLLDIRIP